MGRKKEKHEPRADGSTFHKKYTTKLPVKREADVLAGLAQELAKNVRVREELEDERREMNADFREKFAALSETEKRLATAVETGCTEEDVEVHEYLRRDNAIEVIRVDTGELVEVRTAKAEDLQEDLDLDGKKKGDTEPAPEGDTKALAREQAGA